jgi:hypothetical protein
MGRCRGGLGRGAELGWGRSLKISAFSYPMQDMQAKLEKLLTEAEDCALIAKLAPNERKRELFERLAADLREIARDIERVIAARKDDGEISN